MNNGWLLRRIEGRILHVMTLRNIDEEIAGKVISSIGGTRLEWEARATRNNRILHRLMLAWNKEFLTFRQCECEHIEHEQNDEHDYVDMFPPEDLVHMSPAYRFICIHCVATHMFGYTA